MKGLVNIFLLIVSLCAGISSSIAGDNSQLWMNLAVVADWLQTREIVDDPTYHENNPFLGEYPSKSEVDRHFIAFLALYNLSGEFLISEKNQSYFYYTLAAAHGGVVLYNHSIGIRIKF